MMNPNWVELKIRGKQRWLMNKDSGATFEVGCCNDVYVEFSPGGEKLKLDESIKTIDEGFDYVVKLLNKEVQDD